jgi:isopenicillin N synthase-like dioxygenase
MPSPIPILRMADGPRGRAEFARALGAGLREFGFVGVRGHGVSGDVIEAARRTARAFFALPLERKLACEVAGSAGQRGYTRFATEKAKDQALPDLKEFFHVGREVERDDPLASVLRPNVWPSDAESADVRDFRAAMLQLYAELERVGVELLRGVALHLELEEEWFTRRVARGDSILRAIHYPPLARPGSLRPPLARATGSVRAAAHEDVDVLTLLVGSDEPGLEIRSRADGGSWTPVTTLPETIVVNVGDMLERLTNDLLPSTTHRVVNPPPPWDARSRHSIPFFLHFDPDVVIETLQSCVSPSRPNRHPTPVTANAFLRQRLREIGLLYD